MQPPATTSFAVKTAITTQPSRSGSWPDCAVRPRCSAQTRDAAWERGCLTIETVGFVGSEAMNSLHVDPWMQLSTAQDGGSRSSCRASTARQVLGIVCQSELHPRSSTARRSVRARQARKGRCRAGARLLAPRSGMGIGVTVARVALNHLVLVRIQDPQLCLFMGTPGIETDFGRFRRRNEGPGCCLWSWASCPTGSW